MIDSQAVLYNKVGDDESYTPAYGVEPIIKYIERLARRNRLTKVTDVTIVWCPFDTADSEFVKQISVLDGVEVVYSHIDAEQDFFTYEPEHWHMIVSNPPFQNKRAFFERALSFNKPMALVMTNTWLNDSAPKNLFMEKDLQLLMFDNRMLFYQNGTINTKVTFSCSYYCWNFLPKQIIMEHIMSPAEFRKQHEQSLIGNMQ